jgi:uncharacterized repeat protein (TIGR04138 family)
MQKSFNEIVDQIVEQKPRYDREAYRFVKEALEFTIKQRKRALAESSHHVNAAELLDGFRQFALKEFGPMTSTVLDYWGVRSSEDVGQIVFDLIEAGVFGKTESDSLEDFRGGLDFEATFVQPFEPARTPSKGKS